MQHILPREHTLTNEINQFAAGGILGYTPFSNIPLNLQASFGKIWFNKSSGHMIRFGANVSIPSKSDREKLKAIKK